MTPQDGDILVSKPTATIEHCLSIVGGSTVETCNGKIGQRGTRKSPRCCC